MSTTFRKKKKPVLQKSNADYRRVPSGMYGVARCTKNLELSYRCAKTGPWFNASV